MAKCVQIVGQGVPIRLSDADAHQIVAIEHDGAYCSRSLWKRFYDASEFYAGKRAFCAIRGIKIEARQV